MQPPSQEVLDWISRRVHKRAAEVLGKFNRWERQATIAPDENAAPTLLASIARTEEILGIKSWEVATRIMAAKVRTGQVSRDDVPVAMLPEINRLAGFTSEPAWL